MLYNLQNPRQRENFKTMAEALYNGASGIVELRKKKRPKSISQFRYLHAIIGAFAMEYHDTLKYCKLEHFKKGANEDMFVTYQYDRIKGKMVEKIRSSATLDSAELTLAITRFRNYAAQHLGIYLPEPHELSMIEEIEVEMERNKEYL